jgi:cell division protein FtsQ
MLFVKISLIIFIYVFFTSNYFIDFKSDIINETHEISADFGFILKNIIIVGQRNTEKMQIISTLNADTGTPIFSINLNDVRNKLILNDWIKDVEIIRLLPNTIKIKLVERVPVAIWQINNKLFLIDGEGYQITNDIGQFSNLLHVVGEDANLYVKNLLNNLSQYPEIMSKLNSAVRYGERRWNLNFIQNITIKMPENEFNKALDYIFALNKANKLFNQNYKIIDLRDSKKYYIEKYE